MPVRWLQPGAILLLALYAPARADEGEPETDAIPFAGRPADFSGASGRFQVEARAEPTKLRADQTITFTVTVRATAPIHRPPDRLHLPQVPEFAERFYIDGTDRTTRRVDDRTLEFVYRLKPRAGVSEIPPLPFVYFVPDIRPVSKGFQTHLTKAIPLELLPAVPFVPLPDLSAEVYRLATGPDLLAQERPTRLPALLPGTLLVVAPLLGCAGWYLIWRRYYPDAARQIRRRRSQAARQSLRLLRNVRRLPLEQRAARAAEALTSYLRERFELAAAQPTPGEAAEALRRAGCVDRLANSASRFIAACDAARFAPTADGAALPRDAAQLILAVEAVTWDSRRS